MKKMIVLLSLAALSMFAFAGSLTGNDSEQIALAVKAFAKSADKQDVEKMDQVLHKEYRTVANRLFGSEEVSIIDKKTYLSMMREGKLGGDKRKVKIGEIKVIGNNAMVEATFTGEKLIFETFLQLAKDASGEWKVISDFPKIAKL